MRLILFLVLCLVTFPAHPSGNMVFPEDTTNAQGTFVRVHNRLDYVVHCWVDTGFEYYEFRVSRFSRSRWYRITSAYRWGCR